MIESHDYSFSDDVRRHWGVFLGLMIALVIWCAVDVRQRGIVVPGKPDAHKTDFTVYTEAGAAFFDGREPYSVSNVRGWTYVYPPLFALLMAPLYDLPTTTQVTLFFFLCVALAFGCYAECRRLVAAAWDRAQKPGFSEKTGLLKSHVDRIPSWLFPIAFAAVALPALNSLQRGQVGILKLYPLLLGFRLILLGSSRRECLLGGIVLAFPIALKLTPLLPVCCLLFLLFLAWFTHARKLRVYGSAGHRDGQLFVWSTAGTIVGCAMFFLLIPATIIGWDANLRHLDTFYRKVVARVDAVRADDFGGEVDSPRNQSLFNATYLFAIWLTADPAELEKAKHRDPNEIVERGELPDFPVVNRIVPVFNGLALLALLIATVRMGRDAELIGQGAAFGLACVASLIVSPVARGHYFVLMLPALLFVPLWLYERSRPRAALVAALFPAVICFVHYTMLSTAGRMGVMGIAITLWFFTVCGMLSRINRPAERIADTIRLSLARAA